MKLIKALSVISCIISAITYVIFTLTADNDTYFILGILLFVGTVFAIYFMFKDKKCKGWWYGKTWRYCYR